MKKLFLLTTVLLFGMTACQKTEMSDATSGNTQITVKAALPAQMAETRAAGDGTTVDRCIMQIYLDGELYGEHQYAQVQGLKATFSARLIAGKTYDLVFWADKSGADINSDLHYNTADLANVAFTGDYIGNDDARDAFFGTAQVISDKSQSLSATLRRAVCRINVATGFVPAQTGSHTVDVAFADAPARFDALTGSVSGAEAATSTSTVEIASAGTQLEWYTYLFAPAEAGSRTVNFDMTATAPDGSDAEFSYEFRDIPVQRNYRVKVSVGKQAGLAVNLSAE